MYSVHFYIDERGDVPVRDFIREFNKKSRPKFEVYRFIETSRPGFTKAIRGSGQG